MRKAVFDTVFVVMLWSAAALLIAGLLGACTPASRNWRANTSLDVGYGGETENVRDGYGYLGASYYFDYGVSASVGVWNTPDLLYWGPYYGINYSWVPFE